MVEVEGSGATASRNSVVLANRADEPDAGEDEFGDAFGATEIAEAINTIKPDRHKVNPTGKRRAILEWVDFIITFFLVVIAY